MARPDSLPFRGDGKFPSTRRSLVEAIRAADPADRRRAWNELLQGYWTPIHRYLVLRWRVADEEARDLTQDFLARALERGTFDGYDAERARFRTFLRTCLDHWIGHRLEAARRLKRGGGAPALPLEAAEAAAGAGDPEEIFHREWLRCLFEAGLEALRQACAGEARQVRWQIFARSDLGEAGGGGGGEQPSYAELAAEFSLPLTQVTNHLAWARRELRRAVLAELRRQTASEREFRDEARRAFGVQA